MSHIRLTVGAVTAVAVAASGLALAASASAYGPTSSSVKCRLYFGDAGTGISPSTYTDTFSLTTSPASPMAGTTVTVTLSGATGPVGGPVAIAAGTMNVRATIDLSGAQTGSVALVSAAYPAAAVPPFTASGAWSATGTYVAKAGVTSAALKQLKLDDTSAFDADTYCADSATDADFKATGGAVSTTIVQAATVRRDTVKPTAGLILPAKAKRAAVASWKTLRGVANDVGLGPKSVQVWLTQKRGKTFYYFTGRGWAKAAGAKVAAAKAKRIGVAVSAKKTWALGTKGITKGTLTISYRAVDKAGNIGATKAFAQALVR